MKKEYKIGLADGDTNLLVQLLIFDELAAESDDVDIGLPRLVESRACIRFFFGEHFAPG